MSRASVLSAQRQLRSNHGPEKRCNCARLIAIVGVGGHLAAHLQLDNRQAVYVTGKAAPATGAGQGMRLLEISPPCATFLSQEEETFTYCLDERAP